MQPLVEALYLGNRLLEPEPVALAALCSLTQSLSLVRIVQQPRYLVGERGVVARGDQQGFATMLEDRRDAAHAAGDDRLTGGHPFEDRKGHTLEAGGAD